MKISAACFGEVDPLIATPTILIEKPEASYGYATQNPFHGTPSSQGLPA